MHDSHRVLLELLLFFLEIVQDSLLYSFTLYCYDPIIFWQFTVDLVNLTGKVEVLVVAINKIAKANTRVKVVNIDYFCFFTVEILISVYFTLQILFL